jgi:hypothetical protein
MIRILTQAKLWVNRFGGGSAAEDTIRVQVVLEISYARLASKGRLILIDRIETIRIGVTGHRRIDNPAAISSVVRDALKDILKAWAKTHPSANSGAPPTLKAVSPLAEGADRLVAQEILATAGGKLEVILPLKEEDYLQDFAGEASRREFHKLLVAAESVSVLEEAPNRTAAYEAVGRRVVERCDVLIAIWDQNPARGQGGTGETVAYARRAGIPIYLIASEYPHQLTREGVPGRNGLDSMSERKKSGATLDPVADLNNIKRSLAASITAQKPPADKTTGADLTARLEKVMAHFGPRYAEAESRAEISQNKYRQTSIAIFILATLAVLIVASQSIFHLSHWIIVGEFAAITFILGILSLGNRRGWHMAWLENRLEAEWYRHALFVAFLSGQTTPGIDRHWACRWVANAPGVIRVRQIWRDLPALGEPPTAGLGILKDFMRTAWLEDQIRYHSEKSVREIAKHERISKAGEAAFWLTFIAAGLHLIPHAVYHKWHLPEEPIVRSLTILAIGLPAIGAAFAGLRAHFEYKKIAARSAMMAEHLEDIKQDLEVIDSIEALGRIVQETETLMLQENSDWYFTIGLHELEKG